jgi:hypothetical protein
MIDHSEPKRFAFAILFVSKIYRWMGDSISVLNEFLHRLRRVYRIAVLA